MVAALEALEAPPEGLFWSEPLALESDFKKEDPLALDYLGQQVGLWLFRGFTTRTNRAQYYAVVLYGLHLADKAVRKFGYPGDDKTRIRLFERWERFWALATLEFRGGALERGGRRRDARGSRSYPCLAWRKHAAAPRLSAHLSPKRAGRARCLSLLAPGVRARLPRIAPRHTCRWGDDRLILVRTTRTKLEPSLREVRPQSP